MIGLTESVACGTCTACCRREMIALTEHDRAETFVTQESTHPLTGEPVRMIPHKPDGSCHYLGEAGCTIYDRRPVICRAFSCVGLVRRMLVVTTRAERRRDRLGLFSGPVWDAGMARLRAGERGA